MKVYDFFRQNLVMRIAMYMTSISIMFMIVALFMINSTTEEIRKRRAILNARQNIQLNFEEVLELYSREYQNIKVNLDLLRPDFEEIIGSLELLELESKKLGFEIDINNIQLDSGGADYDFVRYKVSFGGTRGQLDQFLGMLGDLPPYTEIQDISAQASTELGFSYLANYQIVFDIFLKKNLNE
ncbi:hypothetical protein KKG71_06470 [Patescibacteria group bacterium]|nr:hypothetical protein [Patescibacteria group bacterium]